MKRTRNSPSPRTVLQFRIELVGAAPAVWRRVQIDSEATFFDLHCIIQNAIGWFDEHLHAFSFSGKRDRDVTVIEFPYPEDQYDSLGPSIDERTALLKDSFGKIVKQCRYTYDFGDTWEHAVVLEREVAATADAAFAVCVAGKGTCPPENCGGMHGYGRLLVVLDNPASPEHRGMRKWLGLGKIEKLDPNKFDPETIVFHDPKKRLAEWNAGFGV